jgi:hypothetical protein
MTRPIATTADRTATETPWPTSNDPRTDGRPDHRPDVRENAKILGNIANDFNFHQALRAPLILPLHPPFS